MPLNESAAAVSITATTTFQIEILNFDNFPPLNSCFTNNSDDLEIGFYFLLLSSNL